MNRPCKFDIGGCTHAYRPQEMVCHRQNCPWPERQKGVGSDIWWREREGNNAPPKETKKEPPDIKDVLLEFVHDINATGGVCKFEGTDDYAPVGDKDWTDLGETYLKACKALRRRPHIVKED